MRLVELSDSFNTWFHGSKVVNKDGSPMVVYHGTPHGFEEFSDEKLGSGGDVFGSGFYFAGDPNDAGAYTGSEITHNPNIRPAYLAIKRPLIVDQHGNTPKTVPAGVVKKLIMASPDLDDALTNFGDVDHYGKARVLNDAAENYIGGDYLRTLNMISNDFYRGEEAIFLRNCSKLTPYDGVIVSGFAFFIAWSKDQIRSKFDNNN